MTDAVLDDVREWQTRPLEDVYPILFLDAHPLGTCTTDLPRLYQSITAASGPLLGDQSHHVLRDQRHLHHQLRNVLIRQALPP